MSPNPFFFFGGLPKSSAFAMAFGIIMLVVIVIALIFLVIYTVFEGLGLMRMAKRKDIPNGWMGFVPVLNLYLLGKVSNMPDKRRHSEIALLVLGILTLFFGVITLAYIAPFFGMMMRLAAAGGFGAGGPSPLRAAGVLGLFSLAAVITGGLALALMIVLFIALHRIYKQFSPDSATAMTVFTVLAYVLLKVLIHPFLIFAIRNNEIWPMGKPPHGYTGPAFPNIPRYGPNAGAANAQAAYTQPAQYVQPQQTPPVYASSDVSQGSYSTEPHTPTGADDMPELQQPDILVPDLPEPQPLNVHVPDLSEPPRPPETLE